MADSDASCSIVKLLIFFILIIVFTDLVVVTEINTCLGFPQIDSALTPRQRLGFGGEGMTWTYVKSKIFSLKYQQ